MAPMDSSQEPPPYCGDADLEPNPVGSTFSSPSEGSQPEAPPASAERAEGPPPPAPGTAQTQSEPIDAKRRKTDLDEEGAAECSTPKPPAEEPVFKRPASTAEPKPVLKRPASKAVPATTPEDGQPD
eukprot:505592-Alexandrium_andersonii.AAC.1